MMVEELAYRHMSGMDNWVWSFKRLRKKRRHLKSQRAREILSLLLIVETDRWEVSLRHHKSRSDGLMHRTCRAKIPFIKRIFLVYFDPLSEIIEAIAAKCYVVRCSFRLVSLKLRGRRANKNNIKLSFHLQSISSQYISRNWKKYNTPTDVL